LIDWSDCRRVLTFFAHPDDETLAAGATIAKLTGLGIEVHVAIPATGIGSRRNVQGQETLNADLQALQEDCQRAMEVLGVSPERITLGEFPDNEMDRHSLLEVVHWLEEVLGRVKPDLMFTHHGYCTNIDHRICHEAAVVAVRPSVDVHIPILCGEVPGSTGYLRPAHWEPNLYVEVTEGDVERKVQAMAVYRSEVRQDPHPRSPEVLRALAKVRGSEAGFLFAESFMIERAFA
jgi:LmbE family N-acetylglucosaminyl deacetylase